MLAPARKPAIVTTPKGERPAAKAAKIKDRARRMPPGLWVLAHPRPAVIPEADYRRLAEAAEDLADIAAGDRATRRLAQGKDEAIPAEFADRILDGENPVRVWRELRGLTVKALAAKAGIKPAFLSQIETGARAGSVATLRALARALRLTLDDVAG